MTSQPQTLKFERVVDVPPSAVYHAFTNATALREWCCDGAQVDPRAGGRLYMWWNAGYYVSGEFTALEPDETIAFTWHGRGEPAATQVQVALAAQNGGTRVTLTHGGIGAGEPWAETAQEFGRGWESGLENLQAVLETGMDYRLYRRPMLGIVSGQPLDDKIAAELGVPVTEGIQISDVVDGMGAQAAGLQKDDAVVRLGGRPVKDFQTLTEALDPHQAGDEVELVFYRGAEKKTVTMVLSGRPAPDVPPTAEGLAEAVRALYAQLDAELADVLADVSEAEASQPPQPDEWSVRDVLAHLVATQRATHLWVSRLTLGLDLNNWAGNGRPWLGAIQATCPTVPELLEALQRGRAETVAILAALPEEFVARRGSYVRMGSTFLVGLAYHSRAHFEQIRAAIAAARTG